MAKIVKIRVANEDYPVLKSMADAARLDAEAFAGFMMRRLIDMLATDINFVPAFFQYGASSEARDKVVSRPLQIDQTNQPLALSPTGDNLAHAGALIVSPVSNVSPEWYKSTAGASEQEWVTAAEIHALYFGQTGRRINAIKIGLEARRLKITNQEMVVDIEGVRKPVVPKKYAKGELPKLFSALNKLDSSTCAKSPASNVSRVPDQAPASASAQEWLTPTEIHEFYFEQTGRRVNPIKIGLEARRLEITKQETVSTIEGIQKPVVLRKYAKGELPRLFEELNKLDSSAYAKSHHYRFWSS